MVPTISDEICAVRGRSRSSLGRRTRKRPIRHDAHRYKHRWRIEAAVSRLNDFRRVATRYDKLPANFA